MPDEEYLDYVSDATDDERYRAIASANRWLQVQRLQRELKAAREEALAWQEEAMSHRKRLGIPTNVITKRKARKALEVDRPSDRPTVRQRNAALDANKASEPGSGSDDQTKE